MTGDDLIWWLEDLWFDLLNPGGADIPLLIFKLFMLVVAIGLGWQLLKVVRRILGEVLQGLLDLVWAILRPFWLLFSSPVRLPYRWIKNWGYQRRARRQMRAAQQRERDQQLAQQNTQTAEEHHRDQQWAAINDSL